MRLMMQAGLMMLTRAQVHLRTPNCPCRHRQPYAHANGSAYVGSVLQTRYADTAHRQQRSATKGCNGGARVGPPAPLGGAYGKATRQVLVVPGPPLRLSTLFWTTGTLPLLGCSPATAAASCLRSTNRMPYAKPPLYQVLTTSCTCNMLQPYCVRPLAGLGTWMAGRTRLDLA